jgi:hypothetical protein
MSYHNKNLDDWWNCVRTQDAKRTTSELHLRNKLYSLDADERFKNSCQMRLTNKSINRDRVNQSGAFKHLIIVSNCPTVWLADSSFSKKPVRSLFS